MREAARSPVRILLMIVIPAVTCLSAACSGTDGTTEPEIPRATSVTITPSSATMDTLGETVQFSAAVHDQRGQTMSNPAVSWRSSDATVVSVTSTGLATAAGRGSASVTATVGTASGSATVTVAIPPPSITTTHLPDGIVGNFYHSTLAATSGGGGYTWALTQGTLPSGLALDGPSGVISGTPTTSGTAPFTVQVRSRDGQTATRGMSISVAEPGAPWRFTFVAAVTQATADYYGGLAKVRTLIQQQIDTVMARFNDPGVFKGLFEFVLDSAYVTTAGGIGAACVPHPNQDYLVLYDGFPTGGGGWLGSCQSIYHAWSVDSFGGPFSSTATDGLVHEWGHARGAIDLYALQVAAQNNPVNGQGYEVEQSIMNYPYGVTTWDRYTIDIINSTADEVNPPIGYFTDAFPPSMSVQVTDSSGNPIDGADVKLYPVRWYSDSVEATPVLTATTDSNGVLTFGTNPFEPNTPAAPWQTLYCNFLVEASDGTRHVFKWLPITLVQTFYLENQGRDFRLQLTL